MSLMKIDGVSYAVGELRPVLRKSRASVDPVTAGTLQSGREVCDVTGVKYDYELTVEPRDGGDYDAFYLDVTAPVCPRMVTLPFGQSSITFPARLEVDSDQLRGITDGRRWGGLKLRVVALDNVRIP